MMDEDSFYYLVLLVFSPIGPAAVAPFDSAGFICPAGLVETG